MTRGPYREPARRDDTAFDPPAGLLNAHVPAKRPSHIVKVVTHGFPRAMTQPLGSTSHPVLWTFLGILGLGILVSMVMR